MVAATVVLRAITKMKLKNKICLSLPLTTLHHYPSAKLCLCIRFNTLFKM